jgi:hypothetical protein
MRLVTAVLPTRLRWLAFALAAVGTAVCLLLTGSPAPGGSQTAGFRGIETNAGDEPILVATLSNNNEDTPEVLGRGPQPLAIPR